MTRTFLFNVDKKFWGRREFQGVGDWGGKKIHSTLIHLRIGISLPILNCRFNYTYWIHKTNFKFVSAKLWTLQTKKQFWLPDLQKAGGLEMGGNSFAFNSLTDQNVPILYFNWWIGISVVQSSKKIHVSTSKNKSTGREKLVLIARLKNWFI
jgi:hypothetical protein